MPDCHEMKKGEVYVWQDRGLELQVVKECTYAWASADICGCRSPADPGSISCCGKELVRKTS